MYVCMYTSIYVYIYTHSTYTILYNTILYYTILYYNTTSLSLYICIGPGPRSSGSSSRSNQSCRSGPRGTSLFYHFFVLLLSRLLCFRVAVHHVAYFGDNSHLIIGVFVLCLLFVM